jgi:hypothetical protein
MVSSARLRRASIAAGLIALPLVGCAASAATLPPPTTTATTATAQARPAAVATTAIDHLTEVAKRRYVQEVQGGVAHATLRRVARDPALLAALRSGDTTRLRTYVRSQFNRVWYHWHVSRLRILRGSQMLIDVGVPFVVAPSQMTLQDARGRSLATLQTSIQDEIGFVRFMHRNYPVDVVVRGRGAAHVRTSLPAAANAHLPDSGTATVAGARYQVRSFRQTALGNEPVMVWILQRG